MEVFTSLILLFFYLIQNVVSLSIECNSGTVLHDGRCCELKTCYPGTHPVICEEDDPSTTRCQPCPDNSFQDLNLTSNHTIDCLPQTICNPGHIKTLPNPNLNESAQLVTCPCDLNNGWYNVDFDPENPKKHFDSCTRKECPAGRELNETGHCNPCKVGYFKSEESYFKCTEFSVCKDGYVQDLSKSANAMRDVHCVSTTTLRPGDVGTNQTQPLPTKTPGSSSEPSMVIETNMTNTNLYLDTPTTTADVRPAVIAVPVGIVAFLCIVTMSVLGKLQRNKTSKNKVTRTPVNEIAERENDSSYQPNGRVDTKADQRDVIVNIPPNESSYKTSDNTKHDIINRNNLDLSEDGTLQQSATEGATVPKTVVGSGISLESIEDNTRVPENEDKDTKTCSQCKGHRNDRGDEMRQDTMSSNTILAGGPQNIIHINTLNHLMVGNYNSITQTCANEENDSNIEIIESEGDD